VAIAEDWIEHFQERKCELVVLPNAGKGGNAARNTGIRASRGEFICHLDSDDLIAPRKFALQTAALRSEHDADAVYSFTGEFVDGHGAAWRPRVVYDPPDKTSCVLRGWTVIWGSPELILWRRRAIAANGPWDDQLRIGQDWEFVARFLSRDGKLHCIHDVLSFTRRHAQSVSRAPRAEWMVENAKSLAAIATQLHLEAPSLLPDLSARIWHFADKAKVAHAEDAYQALVALLRDLRNEGRLDPWVRRGTRVDGTVCGWLRPLVKNVMSRQHRRLRRASEARPIFDAQEITSALPALGGAAGTVTSRGA
jgi:hypothetical protein